MIRTCVGCGLLIGNRDAEIRHTRRELLALRARLSVLVNQCRKLASYTVTGPDGRGNTYEALCGLGRAHEGRCLPDPQDMIV